MTLDIVLGVVGALMVLLGARTVIVRRQRRVRQTALAAPRAPMPNVLAPVATQRPSLEAETEAVFATRLSSSRGVFDRVRTLTGHGLVSDEQIDVVEEVLLRSDVGVATTTKVLDELRRSGAPDGVATAVKSVLRAQMLDVDRSLQHTADAGRVAVWLFVGVNGVGKTTSIGKLAFRAQSSGHSVVMAAGDTFRAAAAEQLDQWAQRSGADIVRATDGADPGSVIHDAIGRASARHSDLVMADTAGRRVTSVNLLDELAKIRRVADREPGQVVETLLVLDATTGQNALSQAKEFLSAASVTGIILTKLDGTARGGIVVAIESELKIPVKLVGIGEQVGDLVEFEPDEFVDALLDA